MNIDEEIPEYGQDTIPSLSYEEWVVKELNVFNTSAIANL